MTNKMSLFMCQRRFRGVGTVAIVKMDEVCGLWCMGCNMPVGFRCLGNCRLLECRHMPYRALLTRFLLLGFLLCCAAGLKSEPIRIVEFRGDAVAIGKDHGSQLGPQIKLLHEKFLGKWFEDERLKKQALLAAMAFGNHLLPEHRAEIIALGEASGISTSETLLGNCFPDLAPVAACSTITLPAIASVDGVARFGRNLDFPSLAIAEKYSIVMVFHPKDRYAFAAVTWPGLIGVLSGMNEHGLTLACMEVNRAPAAPQGMPYTLLYRMLLERCKTVGEAIDLLDKTPRQTENNLMLMDAAGDRAVVEITREKITVRRAGAKEALISTNHHRGTDADKAGLCSRYDYLHDQSRRDFGQIGVDSIEQMLGHVAQGNMTAQSMVFEPSTRVIYLAVGAEATKRDYQKIDLRKLLQE